MLRPSTELWHGLTARARRRSNMRQEPDPVNGLGQTAGEMADGAVIGAAANFAHRGPVLPSLCPVITRPYRNSVLR